MLVCSSTHRQHTSVSNSLFTLEIYRHAGTWCFTDPERDLLHEPFVLGIPDMINTIIKDKYHTLENTKYRVTFAATAFPKTKFYLLQHSDEAQGYWYSLQKVGELVESSDKAEKGWLCPATLKFFSAFPSEIYVDIEQIERIKSSVWSKHPRLGSNQRPTA